MFFQKLIRFRLRRLQKEYLNPVVNKLQIVMVLRQNANRHLVFELLTKTAAEIVCLEMHVAKLRNSHPFEHILTKRKLLFKRSRRFGTVSLIIGIQFAPERVPGQVPRNAKVRRRHRL